MSKNKELNKNFILLFFGIIILSLKNEVDSMKKRLFLFVLLFVFSILATGCQMKSEQKLISTGPNFFLNSVLDVKILDEGKDIEKINEEITMRVQSLENALTSKTSSSEVSKINQNAGIAPVSVSDETFLVISEGIKYSELADGSFDITVGPLANLWGIGTEAAKVPTEEELKNALSLVGYEKVVLDKNAKTVYLTEKGMALDVGAIAKGYVTDEINSILAKYEVKSAIINLGGNIYARGDKNGSPFSIGIQNPYSEHGDYLGIYRDTDFSMVTSGTYERYFEQDGKKYHHILSTTDGYPVENEIAAVTIISKNSMMADALSTSVFALGIEKGFELIDSLPDSDAIVITKDKKIILSKSMADSFELKNTEFTIEYRD